MARIRRLLDLSTDHLPARFRDTLSSTYGVTAYGYHHGWLMWVPSDVADSAVWDPPPVAVLAIQRYARDQHDCDWVMFDTEGAIDADLRTYPDSDDRCECSFGVLVDQAYDDGADAPPGAVMVQRCDLCTRYDSDEDAADALALRWSTTSGTVETSEGTEAWVMLPEIACPAPNLEDYESESAAVQSWIDGDKPLCLCALPLDRADGRWFHPVTRRTG